MVVVGCADRGLDFRYWWCIVRTLAIPVALVVITLSPWLYALATLKFALRVSADSNAGVQYYHGLDTWSARFSPTPWDARVGSLALKDVSTPYLDAQLNLALLISVLGWLGWIVHRDRRAGILGLTWASTCFAMFSFFLWMSLYPSAFDVLPHIARMLQLAYRAITYQNLSLLLALFALVIVVRKRRKMFVYERKLAPLVVMTLAMVVAATGVLVKWSHASQVMQDTNSTHLRPNATERRHWSSLPTLFYGDFTYTTPSLYVRLKPDDRSSLIQGRIPVGTDGTFGEASALTLTLTEPAMVQTSVQAFPWNRLVLDGTEVPTNEVRVNDITLALPITRGRHTLELRVEPPRVWLILREMSLFVLTAWLATYLWLARARVRPEPATTSNPMT